MSLAELTRMEYSRINPPIVYLSGPISKGDRNQHFYQACHAHQLLYQAGIATINPMLFMTLPWNYPGAPGVDHSHWLKCDFSFVAVSKCVLRLYGESIGGDMETTEAKRIGVPVFVCMYQNVSCIGDQVEKVVSYLRKEGFLTDAHTLHS